MRKSIARVVHLVAALSAASLTTNATAQISRWDGNGSAANLDWGAAANWNTGGANSAPGAGNEIWLDNTLLNPLPAQMTTSGLSMTTHAITFDYAGNLTLGNIGNGSSSNSSITLTGKGDASNTLLAMTATAAANTFTISNQISGNKNLTLILGGSGAFDVAAGTLSISAAINETGGARALTKLGAGTLILSGSNGYTGLTTISAGTLLYGASNVISTGGITVNGATAVLDLGANHTDSVGMVTLDGGGVIRGTGTSALTSTVSFEMKNGSVLVPLAGSNIALNKTTVGIVTLSSANTYTGLTTITGGQLLYGVSNAIASGGVTVNGATAVLDLGANHTDTVGAVTLIDGSINGTGSSALTSTASFDVRNGAVNVPLAGANIPLSKTTSGIVTLNAANTYTGLTTVSGGTLLYGVSDAIASGAISINGGNLDLGANHSDTVGLVTVDGGGSIRGTGTSALTSTASFEVKNGTVTVPMAGANIPLNKTTGGLVTLSGANTYSGLTSITEGILEVSPTGLLGSGPLTVSNLNAGAGSNVSLNLNNAAQTVDTLTGAIAVPISGTNSLAINLGANHHLTVYQSVDATYEGIITGATGALHKTGPATLRLTGNNTYGGVTTVDQGMLVVDGHHSGAGNYTIGAAGSISGSGTITLLPEDDFAIDGTISPGHSPGKLTIETSGAGATIFGGGGSYIWETSALTGIAGTNWDLLALQDVIVSATAQNPFAIHVVSLIPANVATGENPDDPEETRWTIATFSTGINSSMLDRFVLDTTGYPGVDPADFHLEAGASSLDLVMNSQAIPEPASIGLVFAAATMGLHRRRRSD